MRTAEIIAAEQQHILQTYARPALVIERGDGCYLFDTDGNRYLDFVSGLAVNALGYGDPDVLQALAAQAGRLLHVSNLFHTIPSVELARRLVERSFADRVFFCNSGTEAWEASLKICRKWAAAQPGKPRYRFVAMHDSFHGRTYGSLSTTGQPKYHKGFEPLLPGVDFAPFNDLDAVARAVTDETCAILVEPLQAEGGIHVAAPGFLAGLRQLCDERQLLLVFDEIQVGMGRTGRLWAHEHDGVEPDIMTVAKALGGGLPLGVTLLREHVAQVMRPGDHASTFGANPVACAVGQVVLDKITAPGFLASVQRQGEHLAGRLRELQAQWPEQITEVRGRGLIAGAVTTRPAAEYVAAFRARHMLVAVAGPHVVRFLPPLIVTREQIDAVADAFAEILREGVEQAGR